MLRRLSLTVKEQKEVKREVRGAAVPYHEPTSTDDDDDDVDDDTSLSASSRAEGRSWPSTPSTPATPLSTMSPAGRVLSPPPLELSARALLWCSPPGSPPLPMVHLPQCRGDEKGQSLAALAESGDVDGLKAALKEDASSVNDTDEVRSPTQHALFLDFLSKHVHLFDKPIDHAIDTQFAYDWFYSIAYDVLNHFCPIRNIRLQSLPETRNT